MKKIIYALLIVAVSLASIFVFRSYSQEQYNEELEEAIASSSRPDALRELLTKSDAKYHDDLAYLIIYMPC